MLTGDPMLILYQARVGEGLIKGKYLGLSSFIGGSKKYTLRFVTHGL